MPNRILKESICTSETIAKLAPFEEILFYRLIVNCDDFGRFDARPAILKGRLFPLADVTVKAIENALSKLSAVGILKLYEAEGRAYLQLCTWSRHQQTRASKSKYPSPPPEHLQTDENICEQMPADVPVNENVNDTRETNTGNDTSTEPETASAPPVVLLPLNDGTEYPVSVEQCQEWAGLYPAVDVIQQLRAMRGWLLSNSTRRKTNRGISRFVNGWLSKEQDRGGGRGGGLPEAAPPPGPPMSQERQPDHPVLFEPGENWEDRVP